jgi:galactitol-specific phosphotransferase system IIB component
MGDVAVACGGGRASNTTVSMNNVKFYLSKAAKRQMAVDKIW